MAPGIGAGLLLSLACLVCPARAFAQTDDASRAAARDLGTSGVEAYQRDSFAEASAKLEKAYRVLRVPSLGLWSARALVKVGQLVKASERYREVVRLSVAEGDQAVQKQAQTEAAAELDALTPRLPRIVIKLEGAPADDTTVTVDGVAVSSALIGESRVIDPGKHVVEAERAGQASTTSTLAVLAVLEIIAAGQLVGVQIETTPPYQLLTNELSDIAARAERAQQVLGVAEDCEAEVLPFVDPVVAQLIALTPRGTSLVGDQLRFLFALQAGFH